MRQYAASSNPARRTAESRRVRTKPARHWRPAALATFGQDSRSAAARSRSRTVPAVPDPVLLGAGTWLACGIVLLGLTPLPLRDPHLGWSFTFWAVAAPLVVLLAARIRHRSSRIRE